MSERGQVRATLDLVQYVARLVADATPNCPVTALPLPALSRFRYL